MFKPNDTVWYIPQLGVEHKAIVQECYRNHRNMPTFAIFVKESRKIVRDVDISELIPRYIKKHKDVQR